MLSISRKVVVQNLRHQAHNHVVRRAFHVAAVLPQQNLSAERTSVLRGNVFAEFSQLALEHQAVNLGQGFPSFAAPDFVKKAAIDAISHNRNQYARPGGIPELVNLISDKYSGQFGHLIDPMTEVVTFSGAQEGIFATAQAFLNAGDEVVCFEPYFDAYKSAVDLAGAEFVGVPLRPPKGPLEGQTANQWKFDVDELESKITAKTKMIILNTPSNPLGKVFSQEEFESIAMILRKHPDIIVLSDEVYEHMTFDGLEHVHFATLPDMGQRTISLFSAGKTFSATGWRCGYSIAPPHLSKPLLLIRQVTSFCNAPPIEVAVAEGLMIARNTDYYTVLKERLQKKRNILVDALKACGMEPVIPEGGYFVMCDTSKLPIPPSTATPDTDLGERRDFQVARWLTKEIGVTGIPPSAFYTPQYRHLADNKVRFCLCKDDATLRKAAERFATLKDHM